MSEFKDLQPEVCETIESEAPPKICPTCKPDPSYIEPTWWNTDEPYLNKKICEYQVNMVSTKSVAGLVESEIKYEARKLVKKGIREILRKLGKLETNEIVCAFPPSRKNEKCRLYIPPNLLIKLELDVADLEINENIKYNKEDPDGRFNPDSLEVAANVADIYYGDNFELFQVLVSVPAENIDSVPESPFTNEEQDELNETAENTKEVELDGNDFRSNIRKMKAAFLLYGKYQQVFAYTQGIKLYQFVDTVYRPFYLNKYRKRLEEFKDELGRVIKENDYRLTSVESRSTVSKIKIKFDKNEPLRIKSIFVKKKGCEFERLTGIRKLKETDVTTMNYIINLEKMVEKLNFEGEDVPWLDFVTEFTSPALEINFGDVDNNEEPLNSCIDQESVKNFKDNVLRSLLNFSETIQFTLSTGECRTLKDIAENNPYEKQRFNLKESLNNKKKKIQKRRAARKLTNLEIEQITGDIEVSELKLSKSTSREMLDEAISELQNAKSKLFIMNKNELSTLQALREQKKINNSIIKLIENQTKETKKSIEQLEELDLLDPARLEMDDLRDRIGMFSLRKEKLTQVSKHLQEQIDELKDLNKELRKADRKEKRKLTYDKMKDVVSEVYEKQRKELTLLDSIIGQDGEEDDEEEEEKEEGFKILQKLNPCKWDQVSMKVVECLLGGMPFSEAIPLIVETALRNSNPYVIENLLIGLPMEERKRVSDQVKKQLMEYSQELAENFVEPWEQKKEEEELEDLGDGSADKTKTLENISTEEGQDFDPKDKKDEIANLKKKLKNEKKQLEYYLAVKEQLEQVENGEEEEELTPDQVAQLIRLENKYIPQSEKKIKELEDKISKAKGELNDKLAGSSPRLANVARIVMDAYINAMMKSLSLDRLTSLMDKIPGANIFKRLLIQVSCPRVNTLKSGIQDLFGSLSIDVCSAEAKGFFLPAIPDLPEFRGIGLKFALKKMTEVFKGALINLISQLIISLIIRILDLIENGLCNSIGVLGALLANALTGQKGKNGFLDAVNDAFCENEAAKEDTANDLLGRAGIPPLSRREIANALSSAATTNDIKKALVSDCDEQDPKVMKAIWAVINASGMNLNGFFQSPSDVSDLFCTMGSYLTDDQRRAVRDSMEPNDVPVNSSICLTNEERDRWDENRRQFYENQGLDPMAARDFVDGLNKKMNVDLADILDGLAKGPDGLLEEALEEALKPRDPDCVDAGNSIIPPMPEELKQVMKSIAEGVFGSLSHSFATDMIGKGESFFENILADQRGIRLSYGLFSHERRAGFDLLFPNAANSAEDHAQKFEEAGGIQKLVMKAASEGSGDPDPDHLFPTTIGAYMHQALNEQTEQDFTITTEKDGKRKKPDLLIKYRNQSLKDDLDFDFGFNLAYNHFRYPDKFVKSDECSVRKFDIVKSYNALTKKTSTSKNVDLRINSSHGVKRYPDQLEKYDVAANELTMPYVAQLFSQMIKHKYAKAGATGLSDGELEDTYNKMNSLIYKNLMKALLTDVRQTDNLPMGYLFGYNNDKITYEDLLYVNPDATDDPNTWEYTHEEEDAILGKSATGNKRVKFLDPVKYGGKYTKPKIYIEQADHDGWFKIAQIIVPEIDGCNPKRTDFLFLDELTEKVSSLQNSIQSDQRAQMDPACIYEPAFDKFLPPSNLAYIEGTITATIRSYALETFLRCMPIISHLKLDFNTNYSDLFASFIIDKMEDAMQEQGTWPRRVRDYKYWTAFLDQTVQASYRMIKRGDLPNDPVLVELLQEALEVSKKYSRPTLQDKRILFLVKKYTVNGSGKIIDCEFVGIQVPQKKKNRIIKYLNAMAYGAFGKDYKKELLKLKTRVAKFRTLDLQVLKDAEREYDVHENIELAKKILRFHVMKELDFYGKQFQQAFIPQVYINNLSKFLLGASKVPIVSNTEAGLSEIESPVGDSALPNYGTIPSVPSNNESPFANLTEDEITQTKEFGGLFLQKYIRVIQKDETIGISPQPLQRGQGIDRKIKLEGMVSFDQFRQEVSSFTGDKTQYISDVLGNAEALPEEGTYEGSIGVKIGVRVCYALPEGVNPFSSSEETLGAAKAIKEDKAYYTNDENGINYFIPLAHYEQDMIDRTLEEINLEDENFDEDIKCYFDKMVETDEFKFIFESLLITNKVSSLAAIYSYDGFVNSIGLGQGEREEGEEGPNRNILGMEVGWEGKVLDDTKKRLLDLFSSFYLYREKAEDRELQEEEDRKKFMKNLLPSSLFNFDRDVRWWQLRRLQDRPFDKDGKDCASTLASIFKGEE